jgi:O-antigen/teichoic acid export membrane protein
VVSLLLVPLLNKWVFADGDHCLQLLLLVPAVPMMAIFGGELAILKATRQLTSLARISVLNMAFTLVSALLLFYFVGAKAIVPYLVSVAFAQMLFTIIHSYRLYPLCLSGSKGVLGDGLNMVRLGVAFVVAGAMGSGAEMFVRSYLNVHGDLEAVGLYNAGYILIVTYASMVFSAMETDYFPRLSSLGDDVARLNQMVNRQIEVSLLIVSPMLAALIIGLPVLIPLLYSHDFLPVIAMAQVAVFSMYLKALSLPVGYITLAKGDSVAYMVLEGCYDVLFVALLVVGYQWWGLYGAGVALSISYLSDLALVGGWAAWRYHYRVSGPVMYYAAIQLSLGVAVYLVSLLDHPWLYWSLGSLLCLVSLLISLYILHQKTSLWTALIDKFKAHARS